MIETTRSPHPGGGPSEAKFDLFVVHANADRAWVEGYLKPALALEPDRTISPREFDPTATVPAEFERAVTASRFTLLVLSPAFLADEWARFGGQLVSFASVESGQVRLLAVDRQTCNLPLSLRFRVRLDFTASDRWDDEVNRLRTVLDRPAPVFEAVPCPYPGMVPFRKEDAGFFHGRDDEIQRLLTSIRYHHFLIVIGSSGSGKSSLVTAGLLPKLHDWRVLTMRPGAKPIEELTRTLPGAAADPAEAISATLAAVPLAQRLLLVVDQFEELFSQVKDALIREAFIGHLKALRSDPRCVVMMTMRADFYGDLMNSALWPISKSEIIEVVPLRGELLREAIVKPAESAGVYLEEGLVERLLADAADEPGALPMLQEALVLLWGTMSSRLLTRASYATLGRDGRSGLAVAMATKADATLDALPPDQQRLGRRIFLRLIQFGEGRPDTRRQLGIDDLRAETDDPRAFEEFLHQLIANRLLTSSIDDARGLRLDISHEMLIVGWPAAREWVGARRNAEKTRRRLVAKAEEWARLGRGESGLLDAAALSEADRWIASPDADELGIDADVVALVKASHESLEAGQRRKRFYTRLAFGVMTSALVIIAGLAVGAWLEKDAAKVARNAAEIAEKSARQDKEQAEKSAEEARANAAEVLIEAGSTALANGHSFDAMHRFASAIGTLPGKSPAREGVGQGLGFLVREAPRLQAIVDHAGPVNSAAFSPDGSRIVTASKDKTARVWSADSGALLAELKGHAAPVVSAAFSPDGNRIVTASQDKTARVWSADSGALLAELKGHVGLVVSAAFSPDGSRIVTASQDAAARVWSADSGALLAELKGHVDPVHSAAFSPDGSRIVTASQDAAARVWSADSGDLLAELKGHADMVFSAVFSPDGSRIVTASQDAAARVWSADSGDLLAELKGHAASVVSAAFSPDGSRIVTASRDDTARVWRADSGDLLAELKGHVGLVVSAAFSPDGSRIVTASQDKTARVWSADSGALLAELKGHVGLVVSAAFSPDGSRIVTASQDKTARVWRADSGALLAELKGHAASVVSAAFNPDGSRIVTASWDKTARIWRADSGALLAELKGHAAPLVSAAFSPDGNRIVTASQDKTARVWRADSGALLAELKGHVDPVVSAAFNPDGSRIVTASWDKTARVWRADSGALLAELKGHVGLVVSAVFSPDGSRIVTASQDDTARVWRADSGALVAELKGHAASVVSAAFSPDGSRIVTASRDKTARVWRADSGALLAELKGHVDPVVSAAFNPDGSRIVTASWDKTARVWRADSGALLAELKGHVGLVVSAVFSPDGSRIVTASQDDTARVWRADSGALVAELKGHAASVVSAAFSPDGSRIVTASRDKTARVWSADSGDLLAELKGHADLVFSAVFSSDGSRIVTASQDDTARVWSADSGALVAELTGHADPVVSAAFSPDGSRIVTASGDKTARVWRFDTLSGDASILSLWVEVLTGTELKGGVVQPLSLVEWNQRKTALRAQRDKAPPEDWFKTSKPTTSKPTTPAK